MTNRAEVADQGYEYLAQIVAQHDLCTACIKIVGRQDDYVENVKVLLHQKNNFEPERIKKITSDLVRKIILEAKQSERTEFSLLCKNTLIALVGGLESLVKDVVAAEFLAEPKFIEKLSHRALRIQASDLLVRGEDDRARVVVDALYQEEGARRGHTARFIRLCQYVGRESEMKVEDRVRAAIDEACEMRNAIVHRGAKVDHRLRSKVPNVDQEIGTSLELKDSAFRRYRDAIFEFAGKITCWDL